jgi:hypothetical protein
LATFLVDEDIQWEKMDAEKLAELLRNKVEEDIALVGSLATMSVASGVETECSRLRYSVHAG